MTKRSDETREYLTIEEAIELFPRRLSPTAIRDRIRIGVGGVRLRAVKDGRFWFTTKEWIEDFLDKCTEASVERRSDGQTQPQPEEIKESWERFKRKYPEACPKTMPGMQSAD